MYTKSLVPIIMVALLCCQMRAQAQNCEPLQSAGATGLEGLLSGENKISGACILSESEDYIVVRVTYAGFTDKAYKLTGKILDVAKKPMTEFVPVTLDIAQGSTSTDLQFEFKKADKVYSRTSIDSKFLAVSFTSGSDPLAGFDIGGTSLFGVSALYKLERKWSISGGGGDNSNVTVNVKLTPYKSATTIKP
jgi:hypothetical protein